MEFGGDWSSWSKFTAVFLQWISRAASLECPVLVGHVEMQTMQTADCRLCRPCRLCRLCRLSVIFFYLYLNFLVKFLLQFPEGASPMEEGKLFLSVTVLYCHNYLNFVVEEAFLCLVT